MLLWMLVIIVLTVSMIATYYLLPGKAEDLMVHAYAILLVSLAVLYRVFRKMRSRRMERLIEELNYLRMRVAQLEGSISGEEEIEEQGE